MKKLIISAIYCMVLVASAWAEPPPGLEDHRPTATKKARADSLAHKKALSRSAEEWRQDAAIHSAAGFALMAAGVIGIVGGVAWNSEAAKSKEAAEKYPTGSARDAAMETADRLKGHAKSQFIVGGSFLVVGGILNLTAEKERRRAEELELKPYIAPDGKQLGLAVRF